MEPALVSAWRALDVRPAADYRPPPAQAVYSTYRTLHTHACTPTNTAHPHVIHCVNTYGVLTRVSGAGLAQLVSEQFTSAEDKQAGAKGKQDAGREYTIYSMTEIKRTSSYVLRPL